MSVNNNPSPFSYFDELEPIDESVARQVERASAANNPNNNNNQITNNNNVNLVNRKVREINLNSPNPFDWLPLPMIYHIFSFLFPFSTKDLVPVCKSWNAITVDPQFKEYVFKEKGYTYSPNFHESPRVIKSYFLQRKELEIQELTSIAGFNIQNFALTCISAVNEELCLIGTNNIGRGSFIFSYYHPENGSHRVISSFRTGSADPLSLLWAEDAKTTGEFFSALANSFAAHTISLDGKIAIDHRNSIKRRFVQKLDSPTIAITATETTLYTATADRFYIWDRKTGTELMTVKMENPITAIAIHGSDLYVGMQPIENPIYLRSYFAADALFFETHDKESYKEKEQYMLPSEDLDSEVLQETLEEKTLSREEEKVKGFSKIGNSLIVQNTQFTLLISKTTAYEEKIQFEGLNFNASCGWGNLIVSTTADALNIWDPASQTILQDEDYKVKMLTTAGKRIFLVNEKEKLEILTLQPIQEVQGSKEEESADENSPVASSSRKRSREEEEDYNINNNNA